MLAASLDGFLLFWLPAIRANFNIVFLYCSWQINFFLSFFVVLRRREMDTSTCCRCKRMHCTASHVHGCSAVECTRWPRKIPSLAPAEDGRRWLCFFRQFRSSQRSTAILWGGIEYCMGDVNVYVTKLRCRQIK